MIFDLNIWEDSPKNLSGCGGGGFYEFGCLRVKFKRSLKITNSISLLF